MESKKNKSRTYFVPLLNDFIEIHKSLLVDTYLYDIDKPDYNISRIEGLFIMFRWSDNDVHRQYEQSLLDSGYLREHYDIDTEHYMVYLKFPIDFIMDVHLILQGKYSKISEKSKRSIIKYWQATSTSDIYGTLFKTEARKKKLEELIGTTLDEDAELASIIELGDEVFDKKLSNKVIQ